ncbi:Sarcosine oxidase subunit delta [Beijerinckiaceae bacterium RH CH11]|jgi:sarcosine oxidase, subunit delta|nr:sarcosine oxidase subunit delta [Beijerinckiaceae bacterium]VVB49901.1 Sarcosine oxidase subunit delta [Beijerinckiaceae bacterium RH CH11]VVB49978.1 Sarcosine oxidase subunit delta [Beijerinckiaceae bacterium RH AL8]
MLLIACPWCGPRPETEFRCGGQAHIARPETPAEIDDASWSEYLFVRANPRGVHAERWIHAHGCARWFNARRDTTTDRFLETYPMGARPSADTVEAN